MEYNEIKQQIVSNIKENKQKIKDLQVFLKTQHNEYSEAQEKLEEEKQRRRKAKSSKNKFSSFENAINRPPFFSATHVEQAFHEQTFIDNEVPALTATQKEQLIMPQRNKSPKLITYKIDHPLSKLQSDFPTLNPTQMSEKEIKRLEYWQTITNQTTKLYSYRMQNCCDSDIQHINIKLFPLIHTIFFIFQFQNLRLGTLQFFNLKFIPSSLNQKIQYYIYMLNITIATILHAKAINRRSIQNKQLIGSLKKKELEQKHTQVFQLANTNLRLLDPKPSLISENPLTPRRLQKLITLPRLYEKKVWTPNNNYF